MQNIMQMLMQAKQNPQAMLNNLLQSNPQARMLFNQVKFSGLHPKQYVEMYAKQNNINLQEILKGVM